MSAAQPAPDLPEAGGDADPLLGRVLNDRYRIVEPIGHGGMGRVYKALQAPLDRVVALKVLGAGHDSEPNFYKRFFLEASVTARLTHPNTITLYDYGRTEDGIFFIAMEYLAGRNLAQVMRLEGALAQERVIHIAQQICRSLREAHAMGIIHRDLKPANVMLLLQHDDHDFVKVLDFGLSKFFEGEQAGGDITNAGTFMGSPHYIAPEQARNQGPDQRCDIYSLGVMLYHMLTGRVPFTAAAPVDIILKHLHEAPLPPGEARPELHIAADVQEIVLKCMEKARENRYQSMDEVLVALKAARARLTGIAAPSSVPPDGWAFAAGSAQTPPTPQPAMSTPVEPVQPGTAGASVPMPPPPPPEAMLDEYPVAESVPSLPLPQPMPAARRAATLWRVGLLPALILLGGIVTAAIVLRSPLGPPPPPVPAAGTAAPAVDTPAPAPVALATPVAAPPEPAMAAPQQHAPAAPVPDGTTLVIITSSPNGAQVLDGKKQLLGTTPLERRFPSGRPLDLVVRRPGYTTAWLTQKVEGDRFPVHVTMKTNKTNRIRRPVGFKEDPY